MHPALDLVNFQQQSGDLSSEALLKNCRQVFTGLLRKPKLMLALKPIGHGN